MEQLGLVRTNGGDRKSDRQNGGLKSYAAQTADALGLSERSVQRDLTRGRDIDADVLAQADDLNGSQLDEVRRVPRENQAAKVAEIREGRNAVTS